MGVLLTLFLAVAVLTVLKLLSQARFHYSHGIFYLRPCQLFMFELEQGHSNVLNEGLSRPAAPNRFLLWCVRTASARTTTKKFPSPKGTREGKRIALGLEGCGGGSSQTASDSS